MAIQYSCDFCGEAIDDQGLQVELCVSGHAYDPDRHDVRYISQFGEGRLGHYHSTEERPCWAEVVDRIMLIHAVSSDLGPDAATIERRIEGRAEQQQWDEEVREQRERRNAWRGMPQEERESVLLRALADERLTIRELTGQINAELKAPEGRLTTVYESTVASMTKRMVAAGQLGRITESFKNKPRHRYFRKRDLDGPIIDLERAYHDDDEAVR